MANVAFIYLPSNDWVGGKNYYLSVFDALNKVESTGNKYFVFTSYDTDLSDIEGFENIELVRTKVFTRNSFSNYIYRIFNRVFSENLSLYFLLRKYNIHILSHSYISSITGIKSLPWVPDLQHCILPGNFSEKELYLRSKKIQKYLNSDNVLFSSRSAIRDVDLFFPKQKAEKRIYRFTPLKSDSYDYPKFNELMCSYKIQKPFVFLPNQFWKHKNHITCFEALKLARDNGKPFTIVCTGAFSDYRDPTYECKIKDYIASNQLSEHVKLLGLVPRSVFNCLLKESEVLINPSTFEGWSTTVEEGKASRKKMVLSNIPVHLEQIEPISRCWIFDTNNARTCKDMILDALGSKDNIELKRENNGDNLDEVYHSMMEE